MRKLQTTENNLNFTIPETSLSIFKKRFWFYVCVALNFQFLLSCTSIYMPNTPNIPMFTQEGELSAGGHISLKGNISFNTAYAVTDHFALMLNGSLLNSERKKMDFKHSLIEAGAGYFTTFGSEDNRILELYSGYGRGNSDIIKKDPKDIGQQNNQRREAEFNKYFLQVNFTSKRKKSLHLLNRDFPLSYGTALRASYLSLTDHTLNGIDQSLENNIFLEPIFYTRLTLNPSVQLQYTSGSTIGLKNRDALTAAYSVFTVGFVINVGGNNMITR